MYPLSTSKDTQPHTVMWGQYHMYCAYIIRLHIPDSQALGQLYQMINHFPLMFISKRGTHEAVINWLQMIKYVLGWQALAWMHHRLWVSLPFVWKCAMGLPTLQPATIARLTATEAGRTATHSLATALPTTQACTHSNGTWVHSDIIGQCATKQLGWYPVEFSKNQSLSVNKITSHIMLFSYPMDLNYEMWIWSWASTLLILITTF